jgi:PadR family transcriptional regulator, regulatory protein PadR
MADERQVLLPGTLELLVLKTLSIGPLHGYAIVREIQRRSADVLVVEEGSLYPALHRMERRGWIDAQWGQSESNRRAKYYGLSKAGRAELKVQTASWLRLSEAIAQVLDPRSAASEVR